MFNPFDLFSLPLTCFLYQALNFFSYKLQKNYRQYLHKITWIRWERYIKHCHLPVMFQIYVSLCLLFHQTFPFEYSRKKACAARINAHIFSHIGCKCLILWILWYRKNNGVNKKSHDFNLSMFPGPIKSTNYITKWNI